MSSGSETTAGGDVARFINSITQIKGLDGKNDVEDMIKDYLVTDLETRIAPNIIVFKSNSVNLNSLLIEHIGKKFTPEENQAIKSGLSSFDSEHIRLVKRKIETGRNEYSINALDYGTALAIINASHQNR